MNILSSFHRSLEDTTKHPMAFYLFLILILKYFSVSDASGNINITEVKGPLSKDSLDTNVCV